MKLSQLEYFSSVCQHRSITKAASAMHISQPAITKSIHALEAELGVQLFTREKNQLQLTQEGEILLRRSRELLHSADTLVNEMRDFGSMQKKTLKIGIPTTIGTIVLPKLDLMLRERLHCEPEIHEASSLETIQAVREGKLDMGIVLMEDDRYPDLDIATLKQTSLHFCTNASHPLANERSINPSRLANDRIIVFRPGRMIGQLFERYQITPKYFLHTNQLLTIRRYLQSGLASTFQFPEAFANDSGIGTIPLETPMPISFAVIKRKQSGSYRLLRQAYQLIVSQRAVFFGSEQAGQ